MNVIHKFTDFINHMLEGRKIVDGLTNRDLSYDEMDVMITSSEITSGIKKNAIWFGPNPHGRQQRIRINDNPKGKNCITMTLPDLKIIGKIDKNIMSDKDLINIKKFIKLNYQLIMDFTNGVITDRDYVIDNIKNINK